MKIRSVGVVSAFVITSMLVSTGSIYNQNVTKLKQKQKPKESIKKVESIKRIEEPVKKVATKVYYKIPLSMELQDFTRGLCEAHGIEFEMILAIMKQESDFNQKCRSGNNGENGASVGIMQLNENYIEWHGELTGLGNKFNINNIYHNIFAGILVYKSYRHDWEWGYTGEELDIRSLNSYNMGTTRYVNYIRRTGTINWKYGREVMQYKKEVLEKCKVIVQVEDIKD